jgi:hypothetical protein
MYPASGDPRQGPFLTATEARIAAQAAGGGIVKQVVPA